jgi:BNR repeat-like domain
MRALLISLLLLTVSAAHANDIAHFDIATDGEAIHLLTGHGKKGDPAITLFHRRSTDGGTTWSAPVRVNADADRLSAHHPGENPSIAASGDRVIVAWTAPRPNARRGGLIASMISQDAGKTWQRGPAPFQQEAGSQTFMEIVASGNNLHMVWLDSREKQQSLRYARSNDFGKSWSADTLLVPRTCECCWNSLTVGADGTVGALYRSENPRDMMHVGSIDGKTWSKPVSVGGFDWQIRACPHVGGAITHSGKTMHALSWTGKDERWGVYHSSSADGGTTWSRAQRIGTDDARHADLSTTPDGTVVAVWDEPANRVTTLKSARLAPGASQWSAPQTVATLGSGGAFPRVAATKAGVATFWIEGEPRRGAALKVNGRELK